MTFDSEGRLDANERENAARLAIDSMEPILPDKSPEQIIDAKHRFAKTRFDERYLWGPNPETKAVIEAIIYKK